MSMDSGYQMRIVFVNMNHDKKENLKVIFTNELDLSIFDEHFYKVIDNKIIEINTF